MYSNSVVAIVCALAIFIVFHVSLVVRRPSSTIYFWNISKTTIIKQISSVINNFFLEQLQSDRQQGTSVVNNLILEQLQDFSTDSIRRQHFENNSKTTQQIPSVVNNFILEQLQNYSTDFIRRQQYLFRTAAKPLEDSVRRQQFHFRTTATLLNIFHPSTTISF